MTKKKVEEEEYEANGLSILVEVMPLLSIACLSGFGLSVLFRGTGIFSTIAGLAFSAIVGIYLFINFYEETE